jgi:hypothetical protein
MAFNDLETARIERAVTTFMDKRRPAPEHRHRIDFGHRIDGQSTELFEIRPRFRGSEGETQETPFAKMTYVRTQSVWKLYWMKSDLKWHSYDPWPESKTIDPLLDIIAADKHHRFFG